MGLAIVAAGRTLGILDRGGWQILQLIQQVLRTLDCSVHRTSELEGEVAL